VIHAIVPALDLDMLLNRWNQIAAALGEPSRKRKPQV